MSDKSHSSKLNSTNYPSSNTMQVLKQFVEKNKERLYAEACANTMYNADGKATLSKDDDWFDDTIWDS